MKELNYKHFFVVRDGEFIWDDKEMFNYKKMSLEGRKGYAIIEQKSEDASPNQLAYYFGGIIRKECMRSESFGGWKEKQIHYFLLKEVRGEMKYVIYPNGNKITTEVVPEFERIYRDVTKMSRYIEDVIAYLNTEMKIYPKPSSHYKKNRFFMDDKTMK